MVNSYTSANFGLSYLQFSNYLVQDKLERLKGGTFLVLRMIPEIAGLCHLYATDSWEAPTLVSLIHVLVSVPLQYIAPCSVLLSFSHTATLGNRATNETSIHWNTVNHQMLSHHLGIGFLRGFLVTEFNCTQHMHLSNIRLEFDCPWHWYHYCSFIEPWIKLFWLTYHFWPQTHLPLQNFNLLGLLQIQKSRAFLEYLTYSSQ